MKILQESINREVVVLLAEWGHFSMKIKILNVREINYRHIDKAGKGVHASIYNGSFSQQRLSMKCIANHYEGKRQEAIKEWFLLKIASAAEIGPQIEGCFGFDILMF